MTTFAYSSFSLFTFCISLVSFSCQAAFVKCLLSSISRQASPVKLPPSHIIDRESKGARMRLKKDNNMNFRTQNLLNPGAYIAF